MSPLRLSPLVLVLACGSTRGFSLDDQTNEAAVYPDEDGDGIMDHHEAGWGRQALVVEDEEDVTTDVKEEPEYLTADFDGDGTPNYLDDDSDGDGIPDAEEAGDDDLLTLPLDSDVDGYPNFLDLDADDNCVDDEDEGAGDLDGDGAGDYRDLDNDGDGIGDVVEIGPDCALRDTDGDGTPDYLDTDSDGDGISDLYEGAATAFDAEPADTDGDGVPDYLDDDSDGDGIPDKVEAGPIKPGDPPIDTDGDGVPDYADTDADGDGLSDRDEVEVYGTDPLRGDSDGDGFTDGAEVQVGADPLDKDSIIEGIYVTVPERTDVEQSFDFTLNIQKGDVAFLMDTTGSMGSLLNAVAGEFSRIVGDVSAIIPDVSYAVATFDDYNYGSMGGGADRPFILIQQVTNNATLVQQRLNAVGLHGGGDTPESSMEALYQALSGKGYDQNCNGRYDSLTDVPPFVAGSGDAFGGSAAGRYDPSVAGTGMAGGVGFRDSAIPIVVYATDAAMRDPSSGSPTPKGCPRDAGSADVAVEAVARGAKLIGVCVDGCGSANAMRNLAAATSSYADLDGQGVANDPLVLNWNGGNAAFRSTVVGAIDQLVQSVGFNRITLEVQGDVDGFVVDIDPPAATVTGAVSGQSITFTLTFRGSVAAGREDTLRRLTLDVIGDGSVLLDTLDIFVLVPGEKR